MTWKFFSILISNVNFYMETSLASFCQANDALIRDLVDAVPGKVTDCSYPSFEGFNESCDFYINVIWKLFSRSSM